MSSSAAGTISQEFLENCLTISAQALCCYDFCLTFTREIKFMWKLKPSAASLLFFTLRYPALLNTIMVVFGYLSWGTWQTQLVSSSCTVMMRLEMAGDVLILTSSTIFTALRIYALCARNNRKLVWMLVLGLINPVMSTFTFVLSTPYLAHITAHYQTCDIDTKLLGDIWKGMMCARGSGVIFDAVALVLTWKRIKRVTRANSHGDLGEGSHPSGSSAGYGAMSLVLMRDTAVYFGFLLAINGLGIAIGLSHPKFLDSISTWSAVMTSILLSRLMLDLRQSNTTDSAGGTYISHALTTMMFDGSSPAGGPGEDLTHSGLSDMDDEIEGDDDIDVADIGIP